MARLRKPSQNELSIFATPAGEKVARTSPRKALREPRYTSSIEDKNSSQAPKVSRRELRYELDTEDAFLVPKTPSATEALTPRKQRILRPVQSNSKLLQKLSDESLANPEKKQRDRRVRSGTTDTDVGKRSRLMYAKSLAKSVVKTQAMKAKIDVVESTNIEESLHWSKSLKNETAHEDVDIERDEEVNTDLWCGCEDNIKQEEEDEEEEEEEEVNKIEEVAGDDDEEDSVVNIRARRRHPWSRYILSDSDSGKSESLDDGDTNLAFERTTDSSLPLFENHHNLIPNPSQIIDLANSSSSPSRVRVQTASLTSSRPRTATSNDADAFLTYSPPPTVRSPFKAPPVSRPSTPPFIYESPSKLASPSKKRPTIPKAEHLDGRPSLDAFWNLEAVNEWNDVHAPSKPPVSPRKQKWRNDILKMMENITLDDESEDENSSNKNDHREPHDENEVKESSTGPNKKLIIASKIGSPTKRDHDRHKSEDQRTKAERAERKEFAARKQALAESFLVQLDNTLCSGRISSETACTGGIKLCWSKTLQKTAGRAKWRREQIRTCNASTVQSHDLTSHNTTLTIRHHCSIELAEKVVDNEERLYNVLAHEFCHLATFIISGVRNQPHGSEFKAWGQKASKAFADKGVIVTTKHSYKIEYKYIWECLVCAEEYKRHSKSVDPKNHSCGKCRGRLVQTKPAPMGRNKEQPSISAIQAEANLTSQKSRYQEFVKENFARVKADMLAQGESGQMGKVMEVVAKEYRKGKTGETVRAVDGAEKALGKQNT